MSFSKNILLYMSSRLLKIRSVHTYVIPRTVYFGWICMIEKILMDATSEIVHGDGKIRFRLTLCIWTQCAWNESVKRTEHSSCMMSMQYSQNFWPPRIVPLLRGYPQCKFHISKAELVIRKMSTNAGFSAILLSAIARFYFKCLWYLIYRSIHVCKM